MLRSKQSRAYVFRYCTSFLIMMLHYRATCAEADVRVRVRGRVVSVHRQRGQVRVVSVVAAAETTNRRISAAALSFCERTQPHQLAATPIRIPHGRLAWISVSLRVGTPLYTIPAKTLLGFTGQKKRATLADGSLMIPAAGRSPIGPRSFRFRRRASRSSVFVYLIRTQVPKPMFEFAPEGE